MKTMLMEIKGLQSWGCNESMTSRRKTFRFPTKSGIIGMFSAALGLQRDMSNEKEIGISLNDLRSLEFGVRIDDDGTIGRDYRTMHEYDYNVDMKNTGLIHGRKFSRNPSEISERNFIMDAVFIVAVRGEDEISDSIHNALNNPHYALYYGRKEFPASFDMLMNIETDNFIDIPVMTAFENEPSHSRSDVNHSLMVIIDDNTSNDYIMDDPISFNMNYRKYNRRYVRFDNVIPNGSDSNDESIDVKSVNYDPMQFFTDEYMK